MNESPEIDDAAFRDRVLTWVRRIPRGKVASYGQIALLAGRPGAARLVGGILRAAADENLPWQRVVNREGRISTYRIGLGELQRALLEAEGVHFGEEGRCDLRVHGWEPA